MKNKIKKFAIGAAALTAVSGNVHAQSADALIDKLVDKGILTVKEANDLRAESDKGFTTAFQTKTGMPDWVTGYKLYGDFRGRFDGIYADEMTPVSNVGNPVGVPNGQQSFVNRARLRYRLRVGLTVNMVDNMEVGLRLGSADVANPISNSSTFGGDASKKSIYVDAAYGRWTPICSGAWNVMLTIGKMDLPFQTTYMVLDPDYTPEGAAAQVIYKFNDQQSLKIIGGAFVLDETQYSGRDPYLYAGQMIWDAAWTPKVDTSLGLGVFDLVNKQNLKSAISSGSPNGSYTSNTGNSRYTFGSMDSLGNSIAGNMIYNYNPIVVDAGVTYKLDSFPFYTGVFPIKVSGEFMHNPGAPAQNQGWWAGITFGKSGTRRNWDISYRYEYLEADAWYDQLVDDDNCALYVAQAVNSNYPYQNPTTKGGVFGGTNVKGHLVKFNYSLTDSLTLTFTAYINSLIKPVPSAYSSDSLRIMGDLMWKF